MKKLSSLHILVAITGGCVLVLEVVASRILAPYFGNTTYTFSGIISIILLGLSLGYYWGGQIADRFPYKKIFFLIILISGVFTIFIQIVNFLFIAKIALLFHLTTGPIILSVILFFTPAIFLGMLSPYAIKLQTANKGNLQLGQNVGTLFFFSTLGSIIGSLSTSFILIPHFGVNHIIIGTGSVLIIIGLIGCLGEIKPKRNSIGLILLLLFYILISHQVSSVNSKVKPIYVSDGMYEQIMIYDGKYQEQPARFLSLDGANSSAVYKNSSDLAYEYTQYFEAYKYFIPTLNTALVLGSGGYSIPKAIIEENETVTVDVVDIEPRLKEIASKYFNYKDNSRIITHTGDGRRFLTTSNKKYDLIFIDAFSSHASIPSHLVTREFFDLTRKHLTNNGVVIMNIIGNPDYERTNLLNSIVKTSLKIFPNSYSIKSTLKHNIIQNNIIFMYNGNDKIDFNGENLNFRYKTVQEVKKNQFKLSDEILKKALVLEDNYAPVDYLLYQ